MRSRPPVPRQPLFYKENPTKQEIAVIRNLAILDIVIMSLMLLLFKWQGIITFAGPVLAGVSGSILPDFITGIYLLTKHHWLKKYIDFHIGLHYILNGFTITFRKGVVVQAIFLTGFISLIAFT